MRIFVLDTSAIIRLYLPDGPIPEKLEECIKSAWKAESSLLIPELAIAEIGQVLWKKEQAGYIKKKESDEIINAFFELPIEILGHYDLLNDAISIARQHQITVYDSFFIALALKKNADLITADKKLEKTFKKNYS